MTREAPDPDQSVFVQPTPHGIWTANNNFGFSLPFGPQRTNRERIINLPEWGEPRVWTVSLGINFSENAWPGTPRGFDVVGEVNFGTGGATETFEVDWLTGTTFSLPMNAISINAFWASPETASSGASRPEDVKLSVILGRGGRGGGLAPTKFAPLLNGEPYVTLVDNAVAEPVARVPRFAKRLFIVALDRDDLTSLLGSNNFIRFFSAPDPTVSAFGTGAFPIDAASLRTGIVVPAFSKYVSIENVGGGSGGAEVQLNFQLDL